MLSGRYWMSVFPGLALLLMIVSINLVGDRLRELLNPRLRSSAQPHRDRRGTAMLDAEFVH